MPITLDPVASSEGSSWVTTAEADTYFVTRHGIGTLWSQFDDDTSAKAALLVTAQMPIELSTDYEFPEEPTERMKNAVCEQVIFMLLDPDMELRTSLQAQGVVEAGIVLEKYREVFDGKVPIAPRASALLKSLLKTDTHEIPLVR